MFERRRVHREHRSERIGILTGHDLQHGIALRRTGALIDDRLALAPAFVNGARPLEHDRDPDTVEHHVAVVAAVDRQRAHRRAIAAGRQCIELARATV
nr:hypothetical protein [Escherichia coli]